MFDKHLCWCLVVNKVLQFYGYSKKIEQVPNINKSLDAHPPPHTQHLQKVFQELRIHIYITIKFSIQPLQNTCLSREYWEETNVTMYWPWHLSQVWTMYNMNAV